MMDRTQNRHWLMSHLDRKLETSILHFHVRNTVVVVLRVVAAVHDDDYSSSIPNVNVHALVESLSLNKSMNVNMAMKSVKKIVKKSMMKVMVVMVVIDFLFLLLDVNCFQILSLSKK